MTGRAGGTVRNYESVGISGKILKPGPVQNTPNTFERVYLGAQIDASWSRHSENRYIWLMTPLIPVCREFPKQRHARGQGETVIHEERAEGVRTSGTNGKGASAEASHRAIDHSHTDLYIHKGKP